MFFEEDDVDHFSLKCSTNATDLSHFINKTILEESNDIKKSHGTSNLQPASLQNACEIDEADVFFTSLQLKSSKPIVNDTNNSGKSGGVFTRSKISDKPKAISLQAASLKQPKKRRGKRKKSESGESLKNPGTDWLVNDYPRFDESHRKTFEFLEYDIISEEKEEEVDKFLHDENFSDPYLNLELDDFHRDGGKWKSTIRTSPMSWLSPQWDLIDDKPEQHRGKQPEWEEDNWKVPPVEHTRGKWLPASTPNTSGGSMRYYCSACDRTLASCDMFKRHLITSLHKKRVLQEDDLECNARKIDPSRMNRTLRNNANIPPEAIVRKKEARCETCKTKVKKGRWGKHLVSYYHYRRFVQTSVLHIQQVLDHMPYIVLQSPYQCSPCKFYCNTFVQFRAHWDTVAHQSLELENCVFWCRFCKFSAKFARDLRKHLDSECHKEVIRAINGFMPIIIQQRRFLQCDQCDEHFLWNIQLNKHKYFAHNQQSSSHPCDKCSFSGKCLRSLQTHYLRKHRQAIPYYCTKCDVHFESAKSALAHRRSSEHLHVNKKILRKCRDCMETCFNLKSFKLHVEQNHPDRLHACQKCGLNFVFAQELGKHTKVCNDFPKSSNPVHQFHCQQCGYSSNSLGDLLYHRALHENTKHTCVVCKKVFQLPKSLRNHLKCHTNESGFVRKCKKTVSNTRCNVYPCGIGDCEEVFASHVTRMEHRRKHTLICQHCDYRAQNHGLLKRHMLIHSDDSRKFSCSHCDFSARLPGHLKRHMRLHTGVKPYKCPHCHYTCNLLDNLRKHVIGKKSHIGKKLYSCTECSYATNTTSQIKSHMADKHNNTSFDPLKGIYFKSEDSI